MSSDFWARKIGGIAQPRPAAPAPAQGGAWWQDAPAPVQHMQPQQPYGYPDAALQAQMPGQPAQFQQSDGQVVNEQLIQQLRRIPADQLSQQQMELIAEWELANTSKYNSVCPQCSSGNFVPAGTVIQGKRMGSDKCFDCGASSSMYTASPEPAVGGSRGSKAPYRDVRQIDTGGADGTSMYLKFRGVPQAYMPRGA